MHTPLSIPNSKDCQQHPWHPSVVYVAEGWNGYRYWMAQTPFPPKDVPPYRDRYELPCIHYSNDGIQWFPISKNPIEELSDNAITSHNYYSDPHLVLKDGVLECYYRYTILKDKKLEGNKTILLKRTSTNSWDWNEPTIIADLRKENDIAIWGEQIISQALIWDGSQYKCWYVDRSSYLTGRKICYTHSFDGIHWSQFSACSIDNNNIDPWHIDVQHYDDAYQLIVYDMQGLWWFESKDGIMFHQVSKVLSPTQYFMDFYAEGLYRACSVKTDNGIRVYFSAKNKKRTSIGLLQTFDRKKFVPINGYSQIAYLRQYICPQLSKKNLKALIGHIFQ